jgi:CTP synthase (UTP-ammonia lyase)
VQNVLGIDAGEAGDSSSIPVRLISQLSCSLVGERQPVTLTPGTLTFQAYGTARVIEQFNCNYGLNEGYRDKMSKGDLKIVGTDTNGDARIVELSNHPFFIATLFLPQLSSSPETPHPLILAYLNAAIAHKQV